MAKDAPTDLEIGQALLRIWETDRGKWESAPCLLCTNVNASARAEYNPVTYVSADYTRRLTFGSCQHCGDYWIDRQVFTFPLPAELGEVATVLARRAFERVSKSGDESKLWCLEASGKQALVDATAAKE